MTRLSGRTILGIGLSFAVLGTFVLAFWLAPTRLDRADKIASVVGAVATVIGLTMSIWGVVRQRRPNSNLQGISHTVIGGSVTQVSGVGSDLRIGVENTPTRSQPPTLPPMSTDIGSDHEETSTQMVEGSTVSGGVIQVKDVGGDVSIEI